MTESFADWKHRVTQGGRHSIHAGVALVKLPDTPVKLGAGHSIANYETMSFEQRRAAQWSRQQQS